MARYIDADALIRLIEIDALCNGGNFSKRDVMMSIKAIQTADVVPKGEAAKEVLSDLKKAIRNKAVYPRYKDSDPYIKLKDVDEIVADYLKRKTGG